MTTQNFEDWLIGMASAVAVAAVFGAHLLSMPIAGEAIASEADTPDYTITITAKRLPGHCKADASAAGCTREVTETMRAND
jgi:hypothetical protein